MKQTIVIKCQMPNTSFRIKIQEIHEFKDYLVAISNLSTNIGPAGETIIEVKDSVSVQTHSERELPVKHYILNNSYLSKTCWAFKSKDFTVIQNRVEIVEKISEATRLGNLPSNSFFTNESKESAGVAVVVSTPVEGVAAGANLAGLAAVDPASILSPKPSSAGAAP